MLHIFTNELHQLHPGSVHLGLNYPAKDIEIPSKWLSVLSYTFRAFKSDSHTKTNPISLLWHWWPLHVLLKSCSWRVRTAFWNLERHFKQVPSPSSELGEKASKLECTMKLSSWQKSLLLHLCLSDFGTGPWWMLWTFLLQGPCNRSRHIAPCFGSCHQFVMTRTSFGKTHFWQILTDKFDNTP